MEVLTERTQWLARPCLRPDGDHLIATLGCKARRRTHAEALGTALSGAHFAPFSGRLAIRL